MVEVYIDGACLGNPGRIGIGYLICKGKKVLEKKGVFLGIQTNNFAEYMALIFSLIEVLTKGYKKCRVYSDSQLLCNQLKGNFKVKNKNIFPLHLLAKNLIDKFENFQIVNISREENKEVDKLAKKAASQLLLVENLKGGKNEWSF